VGRGEVEPDRGKNQLLYKPIIARTFGTVTHAMFPVEPHRDADADVLAMAGMDTLELVSRLQTVRPRSGHAGWPADHGRPLPQHERDYQARSGADV
jgi:hypothetical protein